MGRNTAVLLAGGVGARVGLDLPKQLIKVAGLPIMEHTLAAFEAHPEVEDIIIMMVPGHLDAVRAMVRDGGYRKVRQILEGGDTRSETTMRALEAIAIADPLRSSPATHSADSTDSTDSTDTKVLLHDAVRPLVGTRIISDCFAALEDHGAVDVAIPSPDTIIEVDPAANTIVAVPRRANLRRGQTPQAFRLSVISEAYRQAARDPEFEATDDCSVVLRYLPSVPIWVVPGDEQNMKVTEPIDVFLADKLFQLVTRSPGPGRDEGAYQEALGGKNLLIFGGSYGIGADVASLASGYGANVRSFSRSTTRTHVERRGDIQSAVAQCLDDLGSIDYVVNTSGVLPRGALLETSEETIYTATEINYVAPILIAQEVHPHLRHSQGSLLLFASSSYTRGRAGYSLYASAKAAVVNLTQALADEWAADSVRVNCINPERTATPMRTKAFGTEPPGTLLDSATVARASLDTLLSRSTGQVFDLRRADPQS